MHLNFDKFWESVHHMADTFTSRLPALALSVLVLIVFYIFSVFVSRMIRGATRKRRQNLGVVFSRLAGAGTVLLGVLIAISIVAPSFQASDLIKVLGIGGVAIGFAFQNILQNFLAGLLLLWAEPFRIGDEIKLDAYEGTVEEIQTRATIIKTYDERRAVIPNADLFTHSVIVNSAADIRHWEYDFTVKGNFDLAEVKSGMVRDVQKVPGTLSEPRPEVLVMELGDLDSNALKLRILWWTKAPRQHQMLTSYDAVLTAIRQTLERYMAEQNHKRERAA
jgi:small conductance mechanosensitive channel